MLFVVADEMVPESRKKGFGREATFGLVVGFIMMLLDPYLGRLMANLYDVSEKIVL